MESKSPLSALQLAELRKSYTKHSLDEASVARNPFDQFARWFREAEEAAVHEPNAMVLATASRHGTPSARVVLLKGLREEGFAFFTNYESRKGRDLEENPRGALVFFWPELERQVRVEGDISRVSEEQSVSYFASRPRGSQLGAWVSAQSEVIHGREVLEERLEELTRDFASRDSIPKPPFWGGYALYPLRMEFWQGRPNRLHDRLLFSRQKDGGWALARLSP